MLDQRDGPRDECGVFGIYAPEHDVARLTYFALYALQHRGQESAGIAAADRGGYIITQRALGPRQPGLQGARPARARRRARDRPRALLDDRLQRVGELAAGAPLGRLGRQPPRARARPQRQPDQRRRAARRAARARRRVLVDLGLGDHRRAARHARRADDRGRDRRRAAAPARRLLDRRDDARTASTASATRPACGRSCSASSATATASPASRARSTSSARSYLRDVQPGELISIGEDGIRTRQVVEGAREAFCVFEYIYFARPDSQHGRHRAAGRARADGRGAGARGAGRRRPRDRRARLRQRRGARLRPRERDPAGRRLRQEPLRRAHVHPARPGAAQARPAAEVQPAAGDRRRQAPRRRRRLDRARQHDAPDHPDAARRGRARGPPADQRAADPQPLLLRHRHAHARGDGRPRPHGRGGRRASRRRLAGLHLAGRRLRGDRAATASSHCDACFSGEYPLAGTDEAQSKFAFERALPVVAG